jgi:hypothetical protein
MVNILEFLNITAIASSKEILLLGQKGILLALVVQFQQTYHG